MDKMKIYEAVSLIDDDIIEDAAPRPVQAEAPASADEVSVSGVEVYHNSKWRRFASAAAVLLLTAGLVSAGALMFRRTDKFTADEPEKPAATYSTAPDSGTNAALPLTSGDEEDTSAATAPCEDTAEYTAQVTASAVRTTAAGTAPVKGTTAAGTAPVKGTTAAGTAPVKGTTAASTAVQSGTSAAKTTSKQTSAATQTTTAAETTVQHVTTTAAGEEKPIRATIQKGTMWTWFESADDHKVSVTISQQPQYVFTCENECIYWTKLSYGDGKTMGGWIMKPMNAYFKDLNADNCPELCVTYFSDQDGREHILAYDILTGKRHYLSDSGGYGWMFTAKDGVLGICRSDGTSFTCPRIVDGNITAYESYDESKITVNYNASGADINRDGKITISDSISLMDYYMKLLAADGTDALTDVTDPFIEEHGDIDRDGSATLKDCVELLIYLRKMNVPGDINEDGKANNSDVEYLRYYIENNDMFKHNLTPEQRLQYFRCTTYGDINGDRTVDEKDLDALKKL